MSNKSVGVVGSVMDYQPSGQVAGALRVSNPFAVERPGRLQVVTNSRVFEDGSDRPIIHLHLQHSDEVGPLIVAVNKLCSAFDETRVPLQSAVSCKSHRFCSVRIGRREEKNSQQHDADANIEHRTSNIEH
jgi:hypothetical protein